MTKPRPIEWLEAETGERIPYEPEPTSTTRHLSVRLPSELATALDGMALRRSLSVSTLVRALVADAVNRDAELDALDDRALADRLAADVEEVRRRLAS